MTKQLPVFGCIKAIFLSFLLLLISLPLTILYADEQASGHIAFLSKRSGSWEVYIMDNDGSHQKRLAHTGKRGFLTWSPDGKQITYQRAMNKYDEIYIMGADGSKQRRLTAKSMWNYGAAWSPDGRYIAFVAIDPSSPFSRLGVGEIHLFDVATQVDHLLMDYGRWDAPSWSPDGNLLALQLVSKAYLSGLVYSDIYVSDTDGQHKALTDDKGFVGSPRWSPDGTHIAFLSDQSVPFRQALYVINSDGSNRRRLTDNQSSTADAPQWSPDGKSVALVLSQPNPTTFDIQDDIYTVDISTGVLRNLTNGIGANAMPSWSLDGKSILFVSARGGNPPQIFLVAIDDMHLTQLTDSQGGNEFPIWQPRSKL